MQYLVDAALAQANMAKRQKARVAGKHDVLIISKINYSQGKRTQLYLWPFLNKN